MGKVDGDGDEDDSDGNDHGDGALPDGLLKVFAPLIKVSSVLQPKCQTHQFILLQSCDCS